MVNKLKQFFVPAFFLLSTGSVLAAAGTPANEIKVSQVALGFAIPNLSEILTFLVRGFFIVAGLAALLFLLMGALSWVTSGGNKENVEKAQQKIQAAIIGVIMVAVVLAVIVTLEQVVFDKKICFGLSCPLTIPSLVKEAPAGT